MVLELANPNPSKATRFKKGQSGNPNGRPKGPDVSKIIKEIAQEVADKKTKRTILEETIRNAWFIAMNGDMKAFKELMDRGFGKPVDKVAMTDSEGNDTPGAIAIPMCVFGSLKEARDKLEE